MVCTKGCAPKSKRSFGILVFFTKFKMAEKISRRKLWVVEANLFIRRYIYVYIYIYSFMTVGQRGQKICLFKVSDGCTTIGPKRVGLHFVMWPSLVTLYHCGKFHKKRLGGFGWAGVLGVIIIIIIIKLTITIGCLALCAWPPNNV